MCSFLSLSSRLQNMQGLICNETFSAKWMLFSVNKLSNFNRSWKYLCYKVLIQGKFSAFSKRELQRCHVKLV